MTDDAELLPVSSADDVAVSRRRGRSQGQFSLQAPDVA